MNGFRKWTVLLTSVLLAAALLAGCGAGETASAGSAFAASASSDASAEQTAVDVNVAALKGPTAMGMVKLTDVLAQDYPDESADTAPNRYHFTLCASPDEIKPKLIQGELDIACVPANLASVLYQKTEGQIEVLAVNTLGVLYIVENGDSVQSMADLKGRTIAAAGKGSTPEYALRYLLQENGLDPDADVTIEWKSEHSECVTALASGEASIALLPQPFVTVAQAKLPDLRVALDLNQEWEALHNGSALLTGVVVARKDFLEQHPEAADLFLRQYADSVDWVNANPDKAARVIGDLDIVDAAVAEKALPACNIVCITGSGMKEKLSGYLEVLYEQNAASIGGQLPGDDFYYGA